MHAGFVISNNNDRLYSHFRAFVSLNIYSYAGAVCFVVPNYHISGREADVRIGLHDIRKTLAICNNVV